METQKAAYMFERACSMHEAAKEMVQLAEQGYMQREDSADPAWQEMLNHATMKVRHYSNGSITIRFIVIIT